MFYNTHAYFSSKLYKSKNNLLLLGSILPDIAITRIIPWDQGLHGKENAKRFLKFLEKNNPKHLFLGKGVYSHCILDDFTHVNYQGRVGYAYQNNEELAKMVGKYYHEDEEIAKKKAHNYIESGVDILLLAEYPKVQNDIKETVGKIDMQELSTLLSSYLKIDKHKFKRALLEYFSLVTKYNLEDTNNWILFWKDLNKIMGLKAIEDMQIKELLDRSTSIVKNTYKDFLVYSLKEGLKEL